MLDASLFFRGGPSPTWWFAGCCLPMRKDIFWGGWRHSWTHLPSHTKVDNKDFPNPHLVKDPMVGLHRPGIVGRSWILQEFLKEIWMRNLLWAKSRSFFEKYKTQNIIASFSSCTQDFSLQPSSPRSFPSCPNCLLFPREFCSNPT